MENVAVLLRVRKKSNMNSFQKKRLIFFSLIIVKILVNDIALFCFVMGAGLHPGEMHKFVI